MHISLHDLGLMDEPKRLQRDPIHVGKVIAKAGRYSAFDATATPELAKTMDFIVREGWFKSDVESSVYPWVAVTLTDKGKEALGL